MGNPYIGEIRMFGGNFAPVGFLFCDGSLQSISDNSALFNLIGTTYGGDGQNTFGLPDLRGRVPVHVGTGTGTGTYTLGQNGGAETVTLNTSQLGPHGHAFAGTTAAATVNGPSGGYLASDPALPLYTADTANLAPLAPNAIGAAGNNSPHNNLMPYQCINFIIATQGIYPSQS